MIRKAQNKDVPSIEKLDGKVFYNVLQMENRHVDFSEFEEKHKRRFRKSFDLNKEKVFVAEGDKGEFLGYVRIAEATDPWTNVKFAFIAGIAVVEPWRRKGIGSLLMDKTEKYCKEKKYPFITLLVTGKNKEAIEFYKKRGFKVLNLSLKKEIGM